VQTAKNLLNEPVAERDFSTGDLVPIPTGETNGEALRRFAQFLSEERNARLAAKSTLPKKKLTKQSTSTAMPPTLGVTPDSNPAKSPPIKKAPPSTDWVPNLEPAPKLKTAMDSVTESYVEHQESAYVTFPAYFPSLTFFDNPFEATHSDQESPYATPQSSYMDPVYSTYSYPQPESESSRRLRPLSSFSRSSQSRTSRPSSYSGYDDSDPGSLIYYDNSYQTSYWKVHAYSSQSSSSTRYKDYFNIFT